MILIADSGSTKTDWCLTTEQPTGRIDVHTQGINPVHMQEQQIRDILANELLPAIQGHIDSTQLSIFFYGAGCTGKARQRLINILTEMFSAWNAQIEAESDLLGAARALCGRREGIACILGTGANSCWYDGKEIKENTPPLGYILGDEGSGAVLGRHFLNALFKGRLSQSIKEKFLSESSLTYADIIERMYRQPLANRFLASTSVFIKKNIDICPELKQLVIDNFCDFFQKNISNYPTSKPNFIGSMAVVYEEELREAARLEGYEIGIICKSPMEGLIAFHSK